MAVFAIADLYPPPVWFTRSFFGARLRFSAALYMAIIHTIHSPKCGSLKSCRGTF